MNISKEMIRDVGGSFLIVTALTYAAYTVFPLSSVLIGFFGYSAVLGIASAWSLGLDPRNIYRAYRVYTDLKDAKGENLDPFEMMDMIFNPAGMFEKSALDDLDENLKEMGGKE